MIVDILKGTEIDPPPISEMEQAKKIMCSETGLEKFASAAFQQTKRIPPI